MISTRLVGVRVLDPPQGTTALVGETTAGDLVGWIESTDEPPPVGGMRERLETDSLAFTAGIGPHEALELLAAWPAWRVVQAAPPEVGARVLVVGAGSLAERVADLAARLGTLVSRSERPQLAARRPWDVVVIASASEEALVEALRACRSRGSVVVAGSMPRPVDLNLYPDIHRRGLRVVAIAPYDATATVRSMWSHGLKGLQSVLQRGATPPSS